MSQELPPEVNDVVNRLWAKYSLDDQQITYAAREKALAEFRNELESLGYKEAQ